MKLCFKFLRNRECRIAGRRALGWALAAALPAAGAAGGEVAQEPARTRFGTTAFMAFRDVDGSFPFARPRPRDRAAYLDLAREAGLSELREAVLQWGEVEARRGGEYDFSPLDDLVVQAGERGIEILGIFTGLPPWATTPEEGDFKYNMSPEDPRTWPPRREFEADFRRFVSAAVRRYGASSQALANLKKPIRYWEFYNEVDAGWWQDPEEYAYWLKAFAEEVGKADPEARVVLAGLASAAIRVANPPHRHNPAYLEDLLEARNLQGPGYPYFHVVNLHNYPMVYGGEPISGQVLKTFRRLNPGLDPSGLMVGYEPSLQSLDVMMAYVRRVLDARRLKMPVWLTEIGDDSRYTGREEQAARLVKYLLHAASLGFQRVYQFCLYDLGAQEGQGRWGLVELADSGQTPARKPAFQAVKTLLEAYKKAESVERLAPGVYRLPEPGGTHAYYLWRAGEADPPLPREIQGPIEAIDIKGRKRTLQAKALQLTRQPLLVRPQ